MLIETLAGPDASKARRRASTAYVDSFLELALDGTQELVTRLGLQPPDDREIKIEIVDGLARVTVGTGAQAATLAAVLRAFQLNGMVIEGETAETAPR